MNQRMNQKKTPEGEDQRPGNNKLLTDQEIFERIHEGLVYNTIETNLSNLIDDEPEGVHDSKEMTIELEKKRTFKVRVHTSHPKKLKKSVRELINHFEKRLDYKLKEVTESNDDSEEESFTQNIRLRKETATEGEKLQGRPYEMNTVSVAEYKERKEQEEFSKRINYTLRPREQDQVYQKWIEEQRAETEQKREGKLQRRKNKMREKLEEAKDHLWKTRDDPDFDKKSEEFIK